MHILERSPRLHMRIFSRLLLLFVLGLQIPSACLAQPAADPLTAQNVLNAIQRGRNYLISRQQPDGSWGSEMQATYKIGVTSLCVLSLIESGLTADDPAVARGLTWLRNVKEPNPRLTYEISLMIMALTAAKEGVKDNLRLFALAQRLEQGQVKGGPEPGGWDYTCTGGGGAGQPDRSNTQYAILGLREAAYAGIPVNRETWQRIRKHFEDFQEADGGWAYRAGQGSTGSMTVAGIASLEIVATFLNDEKETNPDGSPICCQPPRQDDSLERAFRWMGRHFSVNANPLASNWLLYYLYGLERAGRLSGRRFFGTHDWYREGARGLLGRQSKRDGSWRGDGGMENDPIIGTPLALLFLSKGLAPVLINKLKFGPRDPDNSEQVLGDIWNRHPKDVRNLVEHISTLPKWPSLLTWQTLDFNKAVANDSLQEMMQAPILFITSDEDLSSLMSDRHIEFLRRYLIEGGFIFAARGCQSSRFEAGLESLVRRLYPDGSASLLPLPETHPVYRSEYLLDPATVALQGVDVGCRTAIIYSPDDLACLWDKRMVIDPPGRPVDLKTALLRALRIGVNVVAYVTGREPPNKLDEQQLVEDTDRQQELRGVLSIAKLRHSGDWDAAPNATKKLLKTLQDSFGVIAGSPAYKIPAGDPQLYRHTLVYLHGQRGFELSADEIRNVRKYLESGGVLFADACCGAAKFDASFRDLMQRMFPDIPLERIPIEHELFSTRIGHNLENVRRRAPQRDDGTGPLNPVERTGPAFLEGIKIGERYAVIYSKYDISCALEKQTSLSCIGYFPEDAAKIASNVVLYAVLQEVTPSDQKTTE